MTSRHGSIRQSVGLFLYLGVPGFSDALQYTNGIHFALKTLACEYEETPQALCL